MNKIHNTLLEKLSIYRIWHGYKRHSAIHLFFFILIAAIFSYSLMSEIGKSFYSSFNFPNTAKAATNFSETSGSRQPGGRFWFPYPYFGKAGTMNTTTFAKYFDGAYTHPRSWDIFNQYSIDLRQSDPNGVHMKHLNLRVTDDIDTNDIPDETAIHAHDIASSDADKWLLYNQRGATLPVFGWGEAIDYKDSEYLDYVLNDWMPNKYFDKYIDEVSKPSFYVHDNGNFLGFTSASTCMGGATSITNQTLYDKCMWYSKDENSRSAWKTMLNAFKNKYPNKKILISSGSSPYDDYSARLSAVKEIFAYADGYWSESITNDHVHWSNLPTSQISNNMKRNALKITMDTADWLAKNNKYFFVNLGMASVTMGTGPTEPTNDEVDYAWAFFNLMRQGDKQYFSRVTKDASGDWVPEVYDEMDNALGKPLEVAVQTETNLWRRKFEKAIAYVNMTDSSKTITLPSGVNYKNSREQLVGSSFTLAPFRGITIYGEATTATPAPIPVPVVPVPEGNPNPLPGSSLLILSNIKPTSMVKAETNIYLSFNTNQNATCKYLKTPNASYDEMWSFNLSEGKSHSLLLKSLGASPYNYYVKCKDQNGIKDTADRLISFTVYSDTSPTPDPTPTPVTPVVPVPNASNNSGGSNSNQNNTQPVVTTPDPVSGGSGTTNNTGGSGNISGGGSKSSKSKSTRTSKNTSSATVKNNLSTYSSLALGSKGQAVVDLQNILVAEGFLVIPPEIKKGYYGPLTQTAHVKYLSKDTRVQIQNTTFARNLTLGDVGPDVKSLQIYLNNNNYLIALSGPGSKGFETERFGQLTKNALIRFQISKNIYPAVGFFGPVTRGFFK